MTMAKRRRKSWRCFHCDEVFRSVRAAKAHFGNNECAEPACQIDAQQLRDLEEQLSRYRNEDTDLHRQIASMESAHQRALMRAEEDGYAKGLRDGRQIAA